MQPLPRILIIGTQPKHKARLIRKYRGRAELRFFDDKTGSLDLAKAAQGKNYIVLNTQLVRHSHMYALRNARLLFAMTAGAISAIEREIDKYLGDHHGHEETQAA